MGWVLHYIERRKEAKPASQPSSCLEMQTDQAPQDSISRTSLWWTAPSNMSNTVSSFMLQQDKELRANSVFLKGRAKTMTSLCSAPLTRRDNQKNCILSMGKWRTTQSSTRRRKGRFFTSNPYLSLIVFCILLIKLNEHVNHVVLTMYLMITNFSQTHKVLAIFKEMAIAQSPGWRYN